MHEYSKLVWLFLILCLIDQFIIDSIDQFSSGFTFLLISLLLMQFDFIWLGNEIPILLVIRVHFYKFTNQVAIAPWQFLELGTFVTITRYYNVPSQLLGTYQHIVVGILLISRSFMPCKINTLRSMKIRCTFFSTFNSRTF